ncbi:FMRFamide neuropeptides [Stomoxys calcitrans]|uniref:FMRFamide neuropeptides n=1 Tax=Stomoxys calcitrans TaxID=35570 RepID=UPI0027E2AAEA|nr:FMRFamide neuropeptides [Stomoxys calcitrans]
MTSILILLLAIQFCHITTLANPVETIPPYDDNPLHTDFSANAFSEFSNVEENNSNDGDDIAALINGAQDNDDNTPMIQSTEDETELQFPRPIQWVGVNNLRNAVILRFTNPNTNKYNKPDPEEIKRLRSLQENAMRWGKRSYENYPISRNGYGDKNSLARMDFHSHQVVRDSRGDNFMRFGRSVGGSNGGDDNFMRFGRSTDGGNGNDFMRFGRAGHQDFMRFGRGGSQDNFMRFGRAAPGQDFMRFGRAAAGQDFMRFGRAAAGQDFMRFGRAAPGQDFMRFGRATAGQDFMRFGRAPSAQDFMRFGRSPSPQDFMRFGRASAGQDFMRFGRTPSAQDFMRFGRGSSAQDFMRFGRSSAQDNQKNNFVRYSRPDNFMRFGRTPAQHSDFMRFGKSGQKTENKTSSQQMGKSELKQAVKLIHEANKNADNENPVDKAIKVLFDKHEQQHDQHLDNDDEPSADSTQHEEPSDEQNAELDYFFKMSN